MIQAMSTGQYIQEQHNIILLGATGSGKTYIVCAFGMEACKQGFTVRYARLPELLEELAIARGDGSFKKAITQLKLRMPFWIVLCMTPIPLKSRQRTRRIRRPCVKSTEWTAR